MPRILVMIALSTLLCGCASALYEWNMQHAYIAPRARLSQPEIEQIIRTVTQKSLSTIIGMSRFTERGKPDEITVYTELDPSSALMMVYTCIKGQMDFGTSSITARARSLFIDAQIRPNQPMKPTTPLRDNFNVFAATPCRGLSLSR